MREYYHEIFFLQIDEIIQAEKEEKHMFEHFVVKDRKRRRSGV